MNCMEHLPNTILIPYLRISMIIDYYQNWSNIPIFKDKQSMKNTKIGLLLINMRSQNINLLSQNYVIWQIFGDLLQRNLGLCLLKL